jgi:bidirectional [NiFe] hydrogenase diaphorase subunit
MNPAGASGTNARSASGTNARRASGPPTGARPTSARPTVPVTLDGHDVLAFEGETILALARRLGVPIPTLCQLDGISVHGGCRLCIVEVEGEHRLPLACATELGPEMEVRTTSPQLRDHRRRIVALLFAEGSHVCAACVASGDCELQTLATETGVDHIPYAMTFPRHEVDASHPQFVLDRDRCVLCTRCVRVCDEVEGAHVWDIAQRGNHARLVAGMDQPWGEVAECTSCGKCVAACPTGALYHQGTASGERRADPGLIAFLAGARQDDWRDRAVADAPTTVGEQETP